MKKLLCLLLPVLALCSGFGTPSTLTQPPLSNLPTARCGGYVNVINSSSYLEPKVVMVTTAGQPVGSDWIFPVPSGQTPYLLPLTMLTGIYYQLSFKIEYPSIGRETDEWVLEVKRFNGSVMFTFVFSEFTHGINTELDTDFFATDCSTLNVTIREK